MLRERGDWGRARRRGRAEAGEGRFGRGVGARRGEPRRRVVRPAEGLPRRFGMYLPPLLERLGLVELEHQARNNRVRAL